MLYIMHVRKEFERNVDFKTYNNGHFIFVSRSYSKICICLFAQTVALCRGLDIRPSVRVFRPFYMYEDINSKLGVSIR